jgi:hypothetical protein
MSPKDLRRTRYVIGEVSLGDTRSCSGILLDTGPGMYAVFGNVRVSSRSVAMSSVRPTQS